MRRERGVAVIARCVFRRKSGGKRVRSERRPARKVRRERVRERIVRYWKCQPGGLLVTWVRGGGRGTVGVVNGAGVGVEVVEGVCEGGDAGGLFGGVN